MHYFWFLDYQIGRDVGPGEVEVPGSKDIDSVRLTLSLHTHKPPHSSARKKFTKMGENPAGLVYVPCHQSSVCL